MLERQAAKSDVLEPGGDQNLRQLRNDHGVGVRILAGIGEVGECPRRRAAIQEPLPWYGECVLHVFDQVAVACDEALLGVVGLRDSSGACEIYDAFRGVYTAYAELRSAELLPHEEFDITGDRGVSGGLSAGVSGRGGEVLPVARNRIGCGVLKAVEALPPLARHVYRAGGAWGVGGRGRRVQVDGVGDAIVLAKGRGRAGAQART